MSRFKSILRFVVGLAARRGNRELSPITLMPKLEAKHLNIRAIGIIWALCCGAISPVALAQGDPPPPIEALFPTKVQFINIPPYEPPPPVTAELPVIMQ